MRNFWKTPNG